MPLKKSWPKTRLRRERSQSSRNFVFVNIGKFGQQVLMEE